MPSKELETVKNSQDLTQPSVQIANLETSAEWLDHNRIAIAEYNQFVEEQGTFSDSIRSF
ncbi:MAG: type II toxin-antitoxin system CcdA family antitoxin [Methylovulum miyakonense]|uniref:type II toxin-antitoxin system CcdA family antitoxin n=1 Tax=Methylovulum miyakonense TaxID=645578 RepID=UPI003BB71272